MPAAYAAPAAVAAAAVTYASGGSALRRHVACPGSSSGRERRAAVATSMSLVRIGEGNHGRPGLILVSRAKIVRREDLDASGG